MSGQLVSLCSNEWPTGSHLVVDSQSAGSPVRSQLVLDQQASPPLAALPPLRSRVLASLRRLYAHAQSPRLSFKKLKQRQAGGASRRVTRCEVQDRYRYGYGYRYRYTLQDEVCASGCLPLAACRLPLAACRKQALFR